MASARIRSSLKRSRRRDYLQASWPTELRETDGRARTGTIQTPRQALDSLRPTTYSTERIPDPDETTRTVTRRYLVRY